MAEKKFKPGRALLIAAALMLLGLMVYGAIQLSRPPPPAPLPNPNGYDDFVAAAKLLIGDPLYFDRTNALPLRSQVSSNAEALRLLRQGLTKKCRIPQAYSTNYIPGRMTELLAAKRLAWLLEAEGKLAELEHRTNDAARIYLETIRFG